jgi:hypothetical protein
VTTIFALAKRRRRHAEHIGATDTTTVQGARTNIGYVGKHRSGLQAEWKPAHTPGRHRDQHARLAGQRPDRRIEQTQALDLNQLKQKLAVGGAG